MILGLRVRILPLGRREKNGKDVIPTKKFLRKIKEELKIAFFLTENK
jgi:hypothetical protein